MKRNFLKSTFILFFGGFLTKILGMMIKIIMIRNVGESTFGSYMLILPTFSFLIQLGQFGFPIAFAKLIAEENRSSKQLFFSILPILFILHIVLFLLILFLSPFLSQILFHQSQFQTPILAIAFVLPFTSLSSVCRSYFFGKGKMIPHVVSHVTEDLVRMFIYLFLLPMFLEYSSSMIITFLILTNIVSECISFLILFLFLPKNISIRKKDFKWNWENVKDSFQISLPNTGSRFIGSLGYFLEPILLTYFLTSSGYSISYITTEYGIITGYVLPILLLPSFFTSAIAQAIFPILSKESSLNHTISIQRKIKLTLVLSFVIGIIFTLCFLLFPHFILSFLYQTNQGISYLRFLSLFTIFQYIQSILSTSLDSLGKSNDILISVLIGTIVRILSFILFSQFSIGIWSYLLSTACHIFVTTFYLMRKVFQNFS